MAKELPYFQFEPGEYFSGNIQFCSLEAQGLFINICALYWQRGCVLTFEQAKRKYNNETLIDELITEKIIKIKSFNIVIDFLDKQFESITNSKSRLSVAGKKGVKARMQASIKPGLNQDKATLKQPDKIREDKIKEKGEIFFDEKYQLPYEIKNGERIAGDDFRRSIGGMSVHAIKIHCENLKIQYDGEYGI